MSEQELSEEKQQVDEAVVTANASSVGDISREGGFKSGLSRIIPNHPHTIKYTAYSAGVSKCLLLI